MRVALRLFLLLLAATLSLSLLPLLTLADSPSSRRETALTGPYSGPSTSLSPEDTTDDLLWSDIPAVQLGRGLQPPHRWKEFLPRHPASEEDSVKVVLGRTGEERSRLREVDDGPGTRQQIRRPRVSRSKDRVKEEEGWEDGDENEHDDDDDDDDDDDEQQESVASASARKRQKNEQDRQAMGHLKLRAKKEAKSAWKSAKHAAHVVAHPQQAARAASSNEDDDSSSSSSIPLLGALTTLYRLTLSTLSHLYRLTTLLTRYVLHAVTLAYRSTAYALRMTWRAWLAVWASGRYVVRQTLRPVRVVMAPVIYIWLGVRFVLWDVPSYYLQAVLREVYPLYVFLGAALALGTCIGIGCALFLWLGSLITRDSSPLENHLDAWREREVGLTLEKQGRLGFEKVAGRVGREWGKRERERRRRSKGKGKEREREREIGRDTSRRSGARRRAPPPVDRGMDPWDETLGSALDSSSSPLDDDDHDTNGNGAGITPSYLRGLGKDWRPLPKGMAQSLAQRVASASSAAESDEGESGKSGEMGDQQHEGEWSYASGSGQGMGSYGTASGSGSYVSQPQRRGSGGSLPGAAAWRTPTSRGGAEEGDDYFSVARGGAPGITRAVPLESPLSYAAAAAAGDGYARHGGGGGSASSTPQAHAPLGATGRRNRSRRSGEYAGSAGAGGTGSAATTPGSSAGAPLQSPLLSLSQLAGGAMSSSREQQAALSSPEASTRNRRGAQGGIVAR